MRLFARQYFYRQYAYSWLIALLVLSGLSGCQPYSSSSGSGAAPATESAEQRTEDQSLLALANSNGSAQVKPGYKIQFPLDHASHPNFGIEWWYVTANLQDKSGKEYGLQWTLFRFLGDGKSTPWANQQQYMAHVGLHTAEQSWFEEGFARGGVGNAGVDGSNIGVKVGAQANKATQNKFSAYLDDWQWQSTSNQSLFPSTLSFTINQTVTAQLKLQASKPFVLHGDKGYSIKLADGKQASYYYSQPHIQVTGNLSIDGKSIDVSGNGWFDHEWSSQYLSDQGLGWDWFSIHLDSGKKLMLFNVRREPPTKGKAAQEAQVEHFWSGTLIDQNGKQSHVSADMIQASVLSYRQVGSKKLPLDWQLDIPSAGLSLISKPLRDQQLHPALFSYYEGAILISGSETGRGFMELTGY